jgi:hypothetical protein
MTLPAWNRWIASLSLGRWTALVNPIALSRPGGENEKTHFALATNDEKRIP